MKGRLGMKKKARPKILSPSDRSKEFKMWWKFSFQDGIFEIAVT